MPASRTFHRVGHRGAPREFPGNTMRGFARAVELGCTMVECDVRQAADGVLVLAHDGHVTDRLGSRYNISNHASVSLHALDLGAGEGVPTLDELVTWARDRCAVMADMKCEGGSVEVTVVAALAPLPPSQKLVPGAGAASRQRFRNLDPTLPLSLSIGYSNQARLQGDGFNVLLDSLDTQAVTWEHPLLEAARIAALHDHGVQVYAWTVDTVETMQGLLDDGVDGIISNRADLLSVVNVQAASGGTAWGQDK